MSVPLRFRRATTGYVTEAEAEAEDAQFRAGEYLMGRLVKLDDGTVLRQHRVPAGDARGPGMGYDRLDSEIYAGRMLHQAVGWLDYPAELACLYGDSEVDVESGGGGAASADPYSLIEPYRGEPLTEAIVYLDHEDTELFTDSLLSALCWLAAAGIAHRALGPDTVRWDAGRRQVQVTDFSRSAIFGSDRTSVTGPAEWIAPESRPGRRYGAVGPQDDMWAAGRLIFFVQHQGAPPRERRELAGTGLDALLGPPEGRPAASAALHARGRQDPATGSGHGRTWLADGRGRFLQLRDGKHHGALVPPEFLADISWPASPTRASASGPVPGGPASPPPWALGAPGMPETPGPPASYPPPAPGDSEPSGTSEPRQLSRPKRRPWGRGAG
jgi:serine/threonine protein kinase